jgi:hypothetical protein
VPRKQSNFLVEGSTSGTSGPLTASPSQSRRARANVRRPRAPPLTAHPSGERDRILPRPALSLAWRLPCANGSTIRVSIPLPAMPPLTRVALVDRLCDFFLIATQTILYTRSVYPRRMCAGTPFPPDFPFLLSSRLTRDMHASPSPVSRGKTPSRRAKCTAPRPTLRGVPCSRAT